MNSTSKTLTITLLTMLLTSLLILTTPSVTAQAGYKPSTPQFTVKLIDNSYDVPPSSYTVIDQYSGKESIITNPGYRNKDFTVEITIKSKPFTPYKNEDNHEVNRYYNVQVKGHFGDEQSWRGIGIGGPQNAHYVIMSGNGITGNMTSLYINHYNFGAQLDFRVQEYIAYYGTPEYDDRPGFDMGMYTPRPFIIEKTSDWSSIQTITIPDGTTSSQSSQTATQPENSPVTSGNDQYQQPEQIRPTSFVFHPSFLLWIGAIVFVGVIVVVVLVFLKPHLKTPNYNNPLYNA